MSVFGVFRVRIFRHLDWMRRVTEDLSIFSPNVEKVRTRKTLDTDTSRSDVSQVLWVRLQDFGYCTIAAHKIVADAESYFQKKLQYCLNWWKLINLKLKMWSRLCDRSFAKRLLNNAWIKGLIVFEKKPLQKFPVGF